MNFPSPVKRLRLLLCFVICSACLSAQPVTFFKEYKINNAWGRNNFQATSDGGYILSTDSDPGSDTASNSSWGYLVKMDAYGQTQWMKHYRKSLPSIKGYDGSAVAQTPENGGYIIATTEVSLVPGVVMLIRTDSLGNAIWTKQYPGMGRSLCFCVRQTSDLGFIVCGSTTDPAFPNIVNTYLFKTDGSGTIQWGRKYMEAGSNQSGNAYCVNQANDGGYIMTGASYSGTFIIKTDGLGNISWYKNVGHSGSDQLNSIIQTSDGGYIATGYGVNPSAGGSLQITLLKLDSSGNQLWAKLDSCAVSGQGMSVRQTSDGGYAVALKYSAYPGLLKTDAQGNTQWAYQYGFASSPVNSTLTLTNDGGYAMTASWYFNTFSETAILKADSSGLTGCSDSNAGIITRNYTPVNDTGFIAVSLSPSQPYSKALSDTTLFEATTCYNGPPPLGQTSAGSPGGIEIFPNPSSGMLTIVHAPLNARLRILNMLGECVLQSVISSDETRVVFDPEAKGMYFYQLDSDGNRVSSGKLLAQ